MADEVILIADGKVSGRGTPKEILPQMIGDMIAYDLHFMKVTGVVDENGEQGDNEYDDDEAFEYIYDAWLSDHPENDDEEMIVAALLNEYMDLQYRYLCENGFMIEKEVACTDSGKLYTVIRAIFTGEFSMEDEAFYRVGKLDPKDEVARKYIEKQKNIVYKTISDLKAAGMDFSAHLDTYNKIKEILGE